jgi:hypothetical protein
MTSSKWGTFAKCSPDTAKHDIAALLRNGLLRKGGRSKHYKQTL